jgi:hypothetical protein
MSRIPNVWAAIIIPVPASALALILRIKARRMTKMGVGYDDGLSIAAWVRTTPTIYLIFFSQSIPCLNSTNKYMLTYSFLMFLVCGAWLFNSSHRLDDMLPYGSQDRTSTRRRGRLYSRKIARNPFRKRDPLLVVYFP